jgi:tetratricopeptide (TPR) repeat protein
VVRQIPRLARSAACAAGCRDMSNPESVRNDLLTAARPALPYPGLRPFDTNEWSIFFGRERMIDEVMDRLAAHRLVMIYGSSGSGKSSLVRAGVLPKLARQHLRAGVPWRTCTMRPSGGPLWNLAKEFARLEGTSGDVERVGQIVGLFNRRGATLSSIVGSLNGLAGQRVCVLVDQFEELFRFEKETSREEAELFVELLVRSSAEIVTDDAADAQPADDNAAAAHVVVTMRSEYLGECARFDGLAEAINRTQYLVPRMDRDGLTRAIRRPASLYSGEVSLDLTERLIADVAGREDELPLLQHVLMRCWEYRLAHGGVSKPISVDDYQAIGGIADALSQHADEAFDGLPDDAHRAIARRMFQALTEKTADNIEIRRPTSVAALAEITHKPIADIITVVEAFRRPDRSFLMPPADVSLDAKSLIDISHESLIRRWRRMRDWVDQEAESARVYRRLAETAFMHAQGAAALLRDPDLETALRWRERECPDGNRSTGADWSGLAAWATRYHPGFKQAMDLLDQSRLARDTERQQRQLARRRLQFAGSLVTILVAAVAVVALVQWHQYKKASDQLTAQKASLDAANSQLTAINTRLDALNGQLKQVQDASAKVAYELVFEMSQDPSIRNLPTDLHNKLYDLAVESYTLLIGANPTSDNYQGRGVAYRMTGKLDLALADFNKAIELDPKNADAYNSRGNVYLDKKQYKAAIADYTQAIKLAPAYAFAYDNRGDAYDDDGDPQDAIVDYTKAIELSPNNSSFYNDRGLAYFHEKNYDKAIADYTKAVEIDPTYAAAFDNRGDANRDKGALDRTIADYTTAITLDPANAVYYFDRGYAYDHLGYFDEAVADYSQAIQLNPAKASYYDALGDMYYDKKDYDRAIAQYSKAISRDNTNALYYGDRGDAYRKKGQYDDAMYDEAITDYSKAIELDPKNTLYYDDRAHAYDGLGEYDSAIADYGRAIAINAQDDDANRSRELDQTIVQYSKAIAENPDDADAYKTRGAAYDQQGEYRKAIDDYTAAIAQQPNDASAYQGRADTYFDNNDYEHAIADYTKTIALDPTDVEAYKSRGVAYYKKNDFADALPDFTKAISLSPEDAGAYLDRGETYAITKDYPRAIADYSKAIGLGRTDFGIYEDRGTAYYNVEQYQAAIGDFTQAIELNPKNADIYDERGNAYDDMGDHDKAIADYGQAMAINPLKAAFYVDRAIALYMLGNYSDAMADNTHAITLDPKNAAAYKHLADDYSKLGDYDRAIDNYTQAIALEVSISPDANNGDKSAHGQPTANDADVYDRRGNTYDAKGDYDRAIADLGKSIALDPTRSEVFVDRGFAFYGKGDNVSAIANYTQAISLNANNGTAYFSRALAYLYTGSVSKALADLERESTLQPQYPYMALWLEIIDKRANAASRLTQTTAKLDLTAWPVPIIRLYLGQATPQDTLAAANNPDPKIKTNQSCEANFYTGEFLLAQGNKDEATRLFRLAVTGCPKGYVELPAAKAELIALGQNPNTTTASGQR